MEPEVVDEPEVVEPEELMVESKPEKVEPVKDAPDEDEPDEDAPDEPEEVEEVENPMQQMISKALEGQMGEDVKQRLIMAMFASQRAQGGNQ